MPQIHGIYSNSVFDGAVNIIAAIPIICENIVAEIDPASAKPGGTLVEFFKNKLEFYV